MITGQHNNPKLYRLLKISHHYLLNSLLNRLQFEQKPKHEFSRGNFYHSRKRVYHFLLNFWQTNSMLFYRAILFYAILFYSTLRACVNAILFHLFRKENCFYKLFFSVSSNVMCGQGSIYSVNTLREAEKPGVLHVIGCDVIMIMSPFSVLTEAVKVFNTQI